MKSMMIATLLPGSAVSASLYLFFSVTSLDEITTFTGLETIGKYGLGTVLSLVFFRWLLTFVGSMLKRLADVEESRVKLIEKMMHTAEDTNRELARRNATQDMLVEESRRRGNEMRSLILVLASRPCICNVVNPITGVATKDDAVLHKVLKILEEPDPLSASKAAFSSTEGQELVSEQQTEQTK